MAVMANINYRNSYGKRSLLLCTQPFSSKEPVCLSPHVSLIVTDKEEKSKALYMLVDEDASICEFNKERDAELLKCLCSKHLLENPVLSLLQKEIKT